jgi:diguanylate cyclase (GGDEF)-like protein
VATILNLALLCFICYVTHRELRGRRLAEHAVHTATHDMLTQLPNRRLLSERLQHVVNVAKRHHRRVGILFIDLDRFKYINDTLGHEVGDHVLQEIAQRLLQCLRDGDTIARLGGDEFVVVIDEFDKSQSIVAVAEKILAAVAKALRIHDKDFHLTASIGISTFPEDSNSPQELLRNADRAMYRAKEQGKNNYQFYSLNMNQHLNARPPMEPGLRHAL